MLGEEYLKTRDALVELIRYTRALTKRSSCELEDGEDSLEDSLHLPFRIVILGENGSGKTTFLEALTEREVEAETSNGPCVNITRDVSYRVFSDEEDACEKHYISKLKGLELVEVHEFSKLGEAQNESLDYLISGADFVFFVLPAENPWAASSWDAVEQKFSAVPGKSALILQQVDRRDSSDLPMLLGHMQELAKQRGVQQIPMFPLSAKTGLGMENCRDYVNLTINRSLERRRQLRAVYKQTYEMLRRTEGNIDDRSRNLAGDQEFLQSIEAQIDRTREQEVRHVMANMSQLGKLLHDQIKRVVRYTGLRTGVIASHIALFGKGDVAAKIEKFLISKVSEEAENYAESEAEKMRSQCRDKWNEMRPHLENRLSIDVGSFNEDSFDIQQEIFCEGMGKSVNHAMLHLKLRRFLDVQIVQRYVVMRKLLKLALFFFAAAGLAGYLLPNPLGVAAVSLFAVGILSLAASIVYGRKTGSVLTRSFTESLEDAVPALRLALREGYIDRVRAYYNGYTPMFESMRRLISEAKTELEPQQKVAGQLFLRLKALEQEI